MSEGGLINRICDAPLAGPHAWRDALRAIADELSATDAAIYFSEPSGHVLESAISGRLSQDVHDLYFSTYMDQDVQMRRLLQQKPDRQLTGDDLLFGEEEKRCPVHNEYLVPHEISSQIVWMIGAPGRRKSTFVVMRDGRHGSFTPEDERKVSQLVPHLKRSLHIAHRLERDRVRIELLNSIAERGAVGFRVTSLKGEVELQNEVSEQLFNECAAVRRAFNTCLNDARRQLRSRGCIAPILKVATDPESRLRYELVVTPQVHASDQDPAWAMSALLTCTLRPVNDADTQAAARLAAYGLTPAEARLVSHLRRGGALADYAGRRRISIHTARNQLKSVMSKTGTHRQAELVALLNSDPGN